MQSSDLDGWTAHKKSHQAQVILRLLAHDITGRAHDELLRTYLDRFALGGTRDEFRGTVEFLERGGFVRTATIGDVVIVELTTRGEDIVERRATADGIAPIERE